MELINGREDFYKRMGIEIRDLRNLGHVLGLPLSTHFFVLRDMVVTNKMKY